MRQTKTGILLANLGTPDAPTPEAVKRYLKQFLSDRRVVDTSRLLWWPLLRGVILPLRSPRVAKLYASVWMEGGSPLMVYSRQQQQAYARHADMEWDQDAHDAQHQPGKRRLPPCRIRADDLRNGDIQNAEIHTAGHRAVAQPFLQHLRIRIASAVHTLAVAFLSGLKRLPELLNRFLSAHIKHLPLWFSPLFSYGI